MKKKFNTTGVCVSQKHYMVNIDNKLEQIEKLIDNGDYFIINRPRQYGKTTTLSQLSQRISKDYIVIRISFEGIGDVAFSSEEIFTKNIIKLFIRYLKNVDKDLAKKLSDIGRDASSLMDLDEVIADFINESGKEMVLIIDEVDKSSNNQLFLSFLGMMRSKYLLSREGLDITFKSVILAGVHDIKNLKLRLRDSDEKKLNSPWNIAVDFKVDMSFSSEEIETMIAEYCKLNNIKIDTKKISDSIYYYTNGYPFLVSRLCQIIEQDILLENQPWTIEDILKAVKLILKESNTLFDDLIKNLENNQELSDYVFDIIFNGSDKLFNLDNPLIGQGYLYGILKEDNGTVKVSNRIFEQRVYNYFTSKLENNIDKMITYNFRDNFICNDGSLNMEKILFKFQQFMKEQYSNINDKFIEREGRLLFLAFIKPIINGVGFDFKEVQIAEEKRLDVVITYNKFKYIVELKIWYGKSYHEKGLNQLVNYIENQGLSKGYLVIYNFNQNKDYVQNIVNIKNKEIFEIYV